MAPILILPVAYLGYMGSMIAVGLAAAYIGSWQRVSDGRILVFRSPWTQAAFGIMFGALCMMTVPLLALLAPNQPDLLLALILSVLSVGAGLFLLWVCSPLELWIDRQEKIYCCSRRWLTFGRKPLPRPLTDFSSVCALSGGTLLLVFRKRCGLLYGWTLGRFANKSLAQEQAGMFSENTVLPIVDVPWQKRSQRFVG